MAMNPGVASAASPDDIMARKMGARRRMTEARGGMGMARSGQRGPAWATRTAGAETATAGPAVKPAPDTTRPNPMLQAGPAPMVKPLAATPLVGGEIQAGTAGTMTQTAPPAGGLQSLVNLGKKPLTLQELVALQQAQNKPTTRGW